MIKDEKISELPIGSNLRGTYFTTVENGINKRVPGWYILSNDSDYTLSLNSDTNHNTSLSRANGYRKILCDTSDRDLNIILYPGQLGDELEIILNTNGGKVKITGTGQTINGLSTIYLFMQYNRVKLWCDGSNWIILQHNIWHETGEVNRDAWTNKELGHTNIILNDSSGFEIGELITESVSSNTWRILNISGNTLIVRSISGTGFATDTRTITGSYSLASDTVNGTTQNNDTNFYHGFGISMKRSILRTFISTDKTEANRFETEKGIGFIGANVQGINILGVDVNQIKTQTGTGGSVKINDNGTSTTIAGQSWHYNSIWIFLG